MHALFHIRHRCCPDCASSDVEPRARLDFFDDNAEILRGFALFLGALGIALLIAVGGVEPIQKPLYLYWATTHLGAAAICRAGATVREAKAHARCRQCGCLWRP